jgi:DNA end-binding protein Ku
MPRVIWKGAISFGLVHIPVVLHAASSHKGMSFDLVDKRTADPIGYKRINKSTGKEVTSDDIVRAFQYEKGRYVMLGDDEIKGANVESTQTVEILGFVDEGSVPPAFLETPYYLAPDKRGEKVYALLHEALVRTKKIGIASVVLHTKQHLAALMPVGHMLMLDTLRWGDEVIDPKSLEVPKTSPKSAGLTEKELTMAVRLVDEMSTDWDPSQYHDRFREDIEALVERKVKAGKTHVIEQGAPAPARLGSGSIDLTELLKNSLRRPPTLTEPKLAAPKKAAAKKAAPKKAAAKKASKPAARKTEKRARASA